MKLRMIPPAAVIAILLVWGSGANSAPTGSVAKGKALYQDCAACHGASGQGSEIGPDLRGVVGRNVAGDGAYAYSGALRRYGGTWSEDRLIAFIVKPQDTVLGNRMPYAGVGSETKARDVVAYLKTLR